MELANRRGGNNPSASGSSSTASSTHHYTQIPHTSSPHLKARSSTFNAVHLPSLIGGVLIVITVAVLSYVIFPEVLTDHRSILTIHATVPAPPPADQPLYSSHYCIGGRGRYGARASKERSCVFQHVCYRPSKRSWEYYQSPTQRQPIYLDFGRIGFSFDNVNSNGAEIEQVTDAANPNTDGFLKLSSIHHEHSMTPVIVRSEEGVPYKARNAYAYRRQNESLTSTPPMTVYIAPSDPSNVGHALCDDLFGVYTLMSSFAMQTRNFHLLTDCRLVRADFQRPGCVEHYTELLPGLSAFPYTELHEQSVAASTLGDASSDYVCFDRVLAGMGTFGFQRSLSRAPEWWQFRHDYLTGMGVDPLFTPPKHSLIISVKNGKRTINNYQELYTHLNQKFPQLNVQLLDLTTIKGGWKGELNQLINTSILITPCGGISLSAIFLPHHAAIIVVDSVYSLDSEQRTYSMGMEDNLWANLGYLHAYHYPLNNNETYVPEQYIDKNHPENTIKQLFRYGNAIVDVNRMELIVKTAMENVDHFMYGKS